MVNFDLVSLILPSRRGYIQIGNFDRIPSLSAPRSQIPDEGITSIHGDAEKLDIYLTLNRYSHLLVIGMIFDMKNYFCFEYGMTPQEFMEKYKQETGKSFFKVMKDFIQKMSEKGQLKYIQDNTILHPKESAEKINGLNVQFWTSKTSKIDDFKNEVRNVLLDLNDFLES
jgi:hypothetical protein